MKRFRLSKFEKKSSRKGQTALEYALVVAAIILPLAVTVRTMLEDKDDKKNSNVMRKIVSDAYGSEKSLGIIGRPYP